MVYVDIFDSKLLKIDKKLYQKHWYLQHWIHHNKKKKKDDYENVYSVNPMYLIIGEVDGRIEEKKWK